MGSKNLSTVCCTVFLGALLNSWGFNLLDKATKKSINCWVFNEALLGHTFFKVISICSAVNVFSFGFSYFSRNKPQSFIIFIKYWWLKIKFSSCTLNLA